jgi:5-methylcytosine-specific restriction endonuclease McrA
MARNFRAEYDNYHGKPEQIKKRAQRTMARRRMMAKGKVSKGDGMDVDHVKPLSKGGSYADSNLRVVPKSKNRSFPRTKTGAMKVRKP